MQSLFNETTVWGERPFSSRFTQAFERYFDVITQEQLSDKLLWRMLERQFDLKWDTFDAGWRGEYWGKLMRGGSLIYAHTQAPALYEVLTETVKIILTKADEYGRISTYRIDSEYRGWDVWSRKYVMLGLEFYYDICKDEGLKQEILLALERQADYLVKTIGDEEGKTPVSGTSRIWGTINSVSVLQPIVVLNKILKKKSYDAFIQMLLTTNSMENFNIFNYFRNDSLYPYQYPITKAYEMISCAEGLLDLYKQTGEEALLSVCVKFADKVLASDFTLIGGIGCYDELFDNSTKKQVVYTDINKQETCVTVTLMKYLYSLYLVNGRKEYIDAIERSFFNAYLGALNDQPYYGHLVRPLFYSYSPIFDNPRWDQIGGSRNISSYAGFGCCVAIGAAGLGLIPKLNVLGNEKKITVNLFMEGKYELDGASLSIASRYPQEGSIRLTVESCAKTGVELAVRYPYWADGVTISVNGSPAKYVVNGGYILLQNRAVAGDEIGIDFQTPVVVTHSQSVNEDVEGLFAISKCALVYSLDSMNVSLDETYDIRDLRQENCLLTETGLTVKLKTGEIQLEQYRNCGKNYYRKPKISVWLKTNGYRKPQI